MIKVDLKWSGFVCQRDLSSINLYLFIDPYPTLTIPKEGSSGEIRISSNVRWTNTNSVDWFSVTPISGSRDSIQQYVCKPFLTGGRYNRERSLLYDTVPSQIQRVLYIYQKGTDEFLNLFKTIMLFEKDEVANQAIVSFKGESNSIKLRFELGPGDLEINFLPDGFLVNGSVRAYNNTNISGDPGKDATYNFEIPFKTINPLGEQYRYINVFTESGIFTTIRIEILQREYSERDYSERDYNKVEYS